MVALFWVWAVEGTADTLSAAVHWLVVGLFGVDGTGSLADVLAVVR